MRFDVFMIINSSYHILITKFSANLFVLKD